MLEHQVTSNTKADQEIILNVISHTEEVDVVVQELKDLNALPWKKGVFLMLTDSYPADKEDASAKIRIYIELDEGVEKLNQLKSIISTF